MVPFSGYAVGTRFGKTKTPPPVGSGVEKSLEQSEPDRRAAQQQRVRQGQSIVQIVYHGDMVSSSGR
jgi:hypothetical protein